MVQEVWRMLSNVFRPSAPVAQSMQSGTSGKEAVKAIADREEARLRVKLAALLAERDLDAIRRENP